MPNYALTSPFLTRPVHKCKHAILNISTPCLHIVSFLLLLFFQSINWIQTKRIICAILHILFNSFTIFCSLFHFSTCTLPFALANSSFFFPSSFQKLGQIIQLHEFQRLAFLSLHLWSPFQHLFSSHQHFLCELHPILFHVYGQFFNC